MKSSMCLTREKRRKPTDAPTSETGSGGTSTQPFRDFVIGALTGATVVWLWGRTIEDRIAAQVRAVRTMAADGIQAVEETVRPAPATREA